MKVKKLHLGNFKRFSGETFNYCDSETGLAQDLIVIVGRNGSGKSTILQAISAMLATATKRLSEPGELNWPGFNIDLANEAWDRPIEVELDVEFAQNEIGSLRLSFFSRSRNRSNSSRQAGLFRYPGVTMAIKKVEPSKASLIRSFHAWPQRISLRS